MTATLAVETVALAKTFRARGGEVIEAVRGVDLSVAEGEVFGFLGPNGAGKSTTVRMLTTLLTISSGTARVAGVDVARRPSEARRRIGVALQEAGLDARQTGRELLVLQSRMFGMSGSEAKDRARELLELVELVDAADRRIKGYSGGMKRRLDLASALVHEPEVLFLDEPTTGLDPASRLTVWDEVRRINERGTTVFLTTQYLEEADQLCEGIAVIDHGKVIAQGTPGQLKASVGSGALHVRLLDPDQRPEAERVLGRQLDAVHLEADPAALSASCADADRGAEAVAELSQAGVRIADFSLGQPSLDEVFLALTGHPAEDDATEEANATEEELAA